MRKGWLAGGGVVVAVAIGIAVAVSGGKLGALGSFGASAMAAKGPAGAASAPLEFRPSEVVRPVLTTMSREIQFSGPLVAPGTAVVRAKAAGTLLTLAVAEGQRVTAGQVLGRIDVSELSGRVAERNANLESARAALAQAERTHASNERLAAQSFISPNALDTSRSQVETARAALNAAEASLSVTRVGLRDAAPAAPITGVVAKRHVLPGEKVAIEQTLLTIVDLRTLELAGLVGTHEVGSLAPGMTVQVLVEGVDKPVTGRLARIAPAAEPGTRSIGVTIELANPGERLRAGQYAVATVALPDDRQRLALPLSAIGSASGQNHVWLIENGVLARREVITGRLDEAQSRVEVVSGVTAGAQVLAARFDNLREGAKALVVAGRASPLASAALR
ncbi:efflux RND transporter periplasmic adaptor subunit [Ideonella sp. A 288]|uniref:efflux RND transporter periplasmic adaptor subunit n=1 Tax=Ideonella sp. A 288 TaxID=1962181 RepID=UPI000B4A7470|nr:efflux RND transporter periplasmic adaptor subunit [Ideonella sp. A 288]